MAVLFASVAAVVAAVFAVQLLRQHGARRRGHTLAWAISLGLYALASAAMAVGVAAGWSPPVFALYWLGPLLTVPFLALGQVLLLDPSRAVLYWTIGGLCAVWSLAATAMATYDAAALEVASAAGIIPLGREVIGNDLVYGLLRPFTYLFVVVVVGCLWSALRTRRWSLLLIVLGVSISAVASSTAGDAGLTVWFPVLLAAGVTTMYAGFLAAAKLPRRQAVAKSSGAPPDSRRTTGVSGAVGGV